MRRFRVHMHSEPSPAWTFYDGHVDVTAENVEDAQDAALDRLKKGSFPERPRNSWIIDKVETI